MNFASDNAAGVAPEILAAISRANDGAAIAYGQDALTRRVERCFADVFGCDLAVFLVPTGTAANALALAHFSPPWGAVLCHAHAHIATNECGAPEFYGGGLKLVELAADADRLGAAAVERVLAEGQWGGPHHLTPAVLSLTQASEAGTVYRVEEVRELAAIAHRHGLAVHMDGARFANALVRLGTTPAEATWKAGVDVLSLGPPRAVRSRPKRSSCSIGRARAAWRSGASAPDSCCRSTASRRRSSKPISPTACGCGLPAMPTRWRPALASG